MTYTVGTPPTDITQVSSDYELKSGQIYGAQGGIVVPFWKSESEYATIVWNSIKEKGDTPLYVSVTNEHDFLLGKVVRYTFYAVHHSPFAISTIVGLILATVLAYVVGKYIVTPIYLIAKQRPVTFGLGTLALVVVILYALSRRK